MQLSFVSDNYEVSENELQVEVCLMLDGALSNDLSVTVSSKESGSATGGKRHILVLHTSIVIKYRTLLSNRRN